MSPRPEVLALALALAVAACSREKKPAPTATTAEPDASVAAPRVVVDDAAAATPADAGAQLAPLEGVTPVKGKAIGHTSVVFKLETEPPGKYAFKPASRRGPTRYRGEIAAHRLGELLGIGNVPPAHPWSVAREELERALGAGTPAAALCAKECIDDDGRVHGALIPWIDGLAFLPLDEEPLASRWKTWLRKDAPIPEGPIAVAAGIAVKDPKDLARQVSVLVAFDFLTANWDRWSGGNIGWHEARQEVLFIDNDGAFFERPPKDALERNRWLLDGVRRFSRRFVDRLRALDDATLEAAFGPAGFVLPAAVRAQLRARRDELLAHVEASAIDLP